jgi:pimeloyl-ACP methyl ester carboxylesterase
VGATCPRRFVEIGGTRIRVFMHDGREGGGGPAVILIHGAGGNYLQLPPRLRRMAGMLVIAPDLPGHGDSEGNGFDGISAYAHMIADFVRAFGVEQPVVVGHSMGAAIALEYGRLAWDAIGGIGVLAGGVELPIPADLVDGLRTDYAAATEQIASAAMGPNISPRRRELYLERLRKTDAKVLYHDFAACREYDARPYAADLDAPALIVAGERDRLIPVTASRALHELMPRSELHLVEDAGHMFMWERTEEIVRLVAGLVERVNLR